jgi:hypothetical protein
MELCSLQVAGMYGCDRASQVLAALAMCAAAQQAHWLPLVSRVACKTYPKVPLME